MWKTGARRTSGEEPPHLDTSARARWLLVLAIAAILGISAYRFAGRRGAFEAARPVSGVPSASAALPGERDGAAGAVAVRELSHALRRRLPIGPRPVPAQRLAFGAGRVAWLSDQQLVVIDDETFDEVVRLPASRARRVVALADGAFLVARSTGLLLLGRGQSRARELPRPTLFARSRLVADRSDPLAFWVVHGFGRTLYRYRADDERTLSQLLPIDGELSLDGFDSRAFASLRDGSFLYTTADGWSRVHPAGKRQALAGAPADVWRLLAAHRIDGVWVLRTDGSVLLCSLGDAVVSRRTVSLEATPYAAAADDGVLAVVTVRQPDGGSRLWEIVVLGPEGSLLLRRPLAPALGPSEVTAEDDWAARLTRNRDVAVSAKPPLVAVGGPDALVVWDLETGDRRFAAPRPAGGAPRP